MIDLRQVRALTLFTLKSEWRQASVQRMGGRRKMNRRWFYWALLMYLFAGAVLIRIFADMTTAEDYLISVSFLGVYLGGITASNIFLSFSAGFLSPDEATIISPLPVSSRTFFFSRLTVLLVYSISIALLIALPSACWVAIGTDAGPTAGIALIISTVLASITTALGVIVIYGIFLRGLSRAVLSKAIGYVQLLASFIIAASYAILPQLHGRLHLGEINKLPYVQWIPAYWFGSLAAILTGQTSDELVMFAIAALALLALVSAGAHLLLAKHYQAEVAELAQSSQTHTKRTVTRYGPIFRLYMTLARSHEARAVFMLIRAQFRYDTKFRNAILGAIPIVVIYMVLAMLQGGIQDPFVVHHHEKAVGSSLLYFFAMFMPVMLMQNMMLTENYKAAWIFFALPEDRAKLLFSVRNALVISIILPFMVALCGIFSYYMPVAHAIKHVVVLAGIGTFVLQISMIIQARMPFAQPRRPNQRGFTQYLSAMFMAFIPMSLLMLELVFGYRSSFNYWSSFALIATLAVTMEFFVHRRVRVKLEREEFEG